MKDTEPVMSKSGDKYLRSHIDPFDESVDGVKIPDANSQPSVPLKAEDSFSVSTGVGETLAAVALNPTTYKTLVTGTYATASTWTWAAAYGGATSSGKNTKLVTDMDLARPVAHGCRITSGLAPTTVTGFLHVAVFTQSLYNQSTWVYPTSLSDLSNVPGYKRIPLSRLTSEGLTIVNRPLDCTAQRYYDVNAPTMADAGIMEFHVPNQWASIVIVVEGVAASTTPIAIENVIHLECIPRASSIGQATPAASYNPPALGAASGILSKVESAVLDGKKPLRERKAQVVANRAAGRVTGKRPIPLKYVNVRSMRLGAGKRPSQIRSDADGIRNTSTSVHDVHMADYDL